MIGCKLTSAAVLAAVGVVVVTWVAPDFNSGKSGIRPFWEIQPGLAPATLLAGFARFNGCQYSCSAVYSVNYG